MADYGAPVAPCAPLTNWERASEWLTAICVVTFDLELGQALELTYPEHVQLDEKEKMNICYLSFPDSNSGCMGDSKFHIKVRSRFNESCRIQRHQRKCLVEYNHVCPQWNQRAEAASHIYGFVYFRQTKNAQIKRGYFQKSIVLLTRLPFINLFYRLSDLIAPIFFQQPTEMDRMALLSLIFQEIGRWPSVRDLLPQKGVCRASENVLRLKILNKVFQISPLNASVGNRQSPVVMQDEDQHTSNSGGDAEQDRSRQRQTVDTGEMEVEIISNLQEIDLFRHLECIIKEVHLLWELVITNEPIIVIGNSPSISSQVVQSIVSLISPLMYCGEVRPYFTIHDSEFREFTQLFSGNSDDNYSSTNNNGFSSDRITRRNCILGVTNPFFIKTLKDFPHTIRLDSQSVTGGGGAQGTLNGAEFLQQSYLKTTHKRFLQKDKDFVKKIQNGIKLKRPNFVQSLLIQRHFHELTQSFLFPLERYLSLLMPLKREINPFKLDPPQPRPFKESEFLQTIEKNGPQLTSTLKGDWTGLYRRFLQSPNFDFWLTQRVKNQRTELQLLHLETLTTVDVKGWAVDKAEVEVVDLVLKIRQKLNFLQKEFLGEEKEILSNNKSENGDSLPTEEIQNLSLTSQGDEEPGSNPPVDSNRTTAITEADPQQRFVSLKKLLVDQSEKLKSLLPEDLKNIL